MGVALNKYRTTTWKILNWELQRFKWRPKAFTSNVEVLFIFFSFILLTRQLSVIGATCTGTGAIPFNIHTPLWTRISEGVWKSRFWGVVCIGILWSLRFFWGVRQKSGGVFVSALWSFFLRGSNFIDLIHRGVCILNGMAPAAFLTVYNWLLWKFWEIIPICHSGPRLKFNLLSNWFVYFCMFIS
jgi:hypothetical protein